jgi:hypothetical protein
MNRPPSAHRRTQLIALLAAGVVMLTAGCSVGAEPAASATALASVSPAATSSASPTPSRTPSISAPPSASPSPSAPASLPTGWQSCANTHVGFEIGYPGDWHTASLNPQQVCQQFHPIAFTVPVDGEYPLTALNAVQTREDFNPAVSGTVDPYAQSLLREETTVGGRRAIRFEESLIAEGMLPVGTLTYGFVIDRDGTEFLVFTTAVPNTIEYADWKAVVDQAVETLQFS